MNKLLFLLLTSVGLIVSSCEDNSPANSRLNVLLVDEPASYQAVNVEVLGVEINYSSENEDHGWQSLETNTGIYDLLSLTAGNEALLVSTDIEDGTISQIRLLLGNENSVITHDGEYELKTPSGQSAGVKLSLHESFVGGIDYTVILDFDVSKSIIENPVKYILKPVIRARIDALNGAIRGTLDPGEAGVVVYAIQDQEAVTSTYSNESGIFFLRGLEPGSYTVSVDLPEESVFEDLVIENIEVIIGEVSELGTLNLTEK